MMLDGSSDIVGDLETKYSELFNEDDTHLV